MNNILVVAPGRNNPKHYLTTLLAGGILAISLSAWAANPVVTDGGQFLKIQGKQISTGTSTTDQDVTYVRKIELVALQTVNQQA